jgi:hypothetical protein
VFGDDVEVEFVRRHRDLDDHDAGEQQAKDGVDAAAGEDDAGVVVAPDDGGYRGGGGDEEGERQ